MKCNAACTFAELSIDHNKYVLRCKVLGQMKVRNPEKDDLVGEYPFGSTPDFQCKLPAHTFISAAKLEIDWLEFMIEIAKNQEAISDVR